MSLVTWNPNDKSGNTALSDDNLVAHNNRSGSGGGVRATKGVIDGKWYWEVEALAGQYLNTGVSNKNATLDNYLGTDKYARAYIHNGGKRYPDERYGDPYGAGDIIGVSLDMSKGTIEFYKNGKSQGIAFDDVDSLDEVFPAAGKGTLGTNSYKANFGASPFDIIEQNPEVYERLLDYGYLPYDIDNAHKDNILNETLHLIKSHNKIQSLSKNNEWVDTGLTEPLTQVDFEQHGIDNLSAVPKEKWQELDDSFEVITWADEEPVEFEDRVNGSELEWTEEGRLFEMVMDDEREILKLNNVEVK